MPKLSLPLTDSFTVYTRSAGQNINSYTSVMDIMTSLIQDEATGQQLILTNAKGFETKSLKEMAQLVFQSPLFQFGLTGDAVSATMGEDQLRMLEKVSAYLTENQISAKPLSPGQAYLFSVMLVNDLHDRQADKSPSCKGIYKLDEYSPRTGRTGRMFALGVV